MDDLKACPVCRKVPKLGYCCGEYFVSGEDADCPCCGTAFTEMHSSAEREVAAWNRRAEGNWGKPIRKEEAIKILARHLMQCGALMPMEWVQKNGAGSEFMQAFELAMAALKNEPVRCEECKRCVFWRNAWGESGFKCKLFCADIDPDDFCSYGERRTVGDK